MGKRISRLLRAEGTPLLERIPISHGQIASCADRKEILNRDIPTFGFRNIVPCMIIKDSDDVWTPCGQTLPFKDTTHFLDPDGLLNGGRDLGLSFCLPWWSLRDLSFGGFERRFYGKEFVHSEPFH